MQFPHARDRYLCPPISHLPCPPPCPSHSSVKDVCSKYYQEIGAEMIGNQLIIRVEKDKSKSKKKRDEWDPPCDCAEIQRPTIKKGPKIINAGYDDRIVFRVRSTSHVGEKEQLAYTSQTIAYKVGSCRDEKDSHGCKTITVYPRLNGPGSQEVYTDHITEDNQDIFLLRIKKKAESAEERNRNVELELRTPKPPKPPMPPSALAVAPLQPVADLVEKDVKEPNTTEYREKTEEETKRKEKKKKKKK